MSENKTSYTDGTVTLGGTLTFIQMAEVEDAFKNLALEAVTGNHTAALAGITEIAEILGVDVANVGDAEAVQHEAV